MSERHVERGEDAPVEQTTRRPGERRNTGGAGPRRGEDADVPTEEDQEDDEAEEDEPRHRSLGRVETR